MRSGIDFGDPLPCVEELRVDEKHVRVLFIEDRTDVADEIRGSLGRTERGSFDVTRETDLIEGVAMIEGESFDLLLLDLSLANVERSTAIELANDLAHRLPVVVLTGTEELDEPDAKICQGLKVCIEHADLAGKLLSAIRRSRRFGTGVMTPLFCRIEGLCR
jgi:DNA-binding NtrC family response regulator